jgi:hypothetical protein
MERVERGVRLPRRGTSQIDDDAGNPLGELSHNTSSFSKIPLRNGETSGLGPAVFIRPIA